MRVLLLLLPRLPCRYQHRPHPLHHHLIPVAATTIIIVINPCRGFVSLADDDVVAVAAMVSRKGLHDLYPEKSNSVYHPICNKPLEP